MAEPVTLKGQLIFVWLGRYHQQTETREAKCTSFCSMFFNCILVEFNQFSVELNSSYYSLTCIHLIPLVLLRSGTDHIDKTSPGVPFLRYVSGIHP